MIIREFAGRREGRNEKRMEDEVLLAAVNLEDLCKAWEVFRSLPEQCGPSNVDEVSKLVPGADVKALMAHIAVLKEITERSIPTISTLSKRLKLSPPLQSKTKRPCRGLNSIPQSLDR
jgi:hypothetical protein